MYTTRKVYQAPILFAQYRQTLYAHLIREAAVMGHSNERRCAVPLSRGETTESEILALAVVVARAETSLRVYTTSTEVD
ncbi:hypothetical protein J6590_013306 [Homalodisca vitripennis]|nr:hypothetical protein J6590_013306 [Homalodisca vitripennis]